MTDPLEDVAVLSLEERRAVCRWVEDRFVNAIQPLSIRLQRESPVNMACDETLQAAQAAVDHVMRHVNEIRRVAGVRVDPRWGAAEAQGSRGAEAIGGAGDRESGGRGDRENREP